MAGRFVNPYPQYLDSTPEVRSGAQLFFYEAGTSTKLDTYSDDGLSSANTNPIVLNSAGFPSVDIYLQDQAYKVVFAASTDSDPPASPIWTADNVRARDAALIAKTSTGSGSPNGSVAGTAGSASVIPDFYWDYTNQILYVCTTSGTTSTAVWTAVNASAATPAVPFPQGRLTLTSATPVIATSTAAAAAVYYTPYTGNLIPIYNGTTMVPTEFSELTLTLVSSHASSTLYDIFVFSNSGVVTLVTGPAWTTSTAGSGARGTGASTTEITRVKGLWVNAVQMTARNGSTTYTVGANLATYVGTMSVDSSAGQVTCHVAWGQSRKWGLWNAYNRVPIILKEGDATASTWTTSSTTWQPSRNDSNNSIAVLMGLPEEYVDCTFTQTIICLTNANTSQANIGIGINSTSSVSGQYGYNYLANAVASNISLQTTPKAHHVMPPSIGINAVNALQQVPNGTTNNTFQGNEAGMILSAVWRG